MAQHDPYKRLVTLDVEEALWERVFTVAPLVLIGTREPDGGYNLAPKHMVTPMGWSNYFGFVCTPRHGTYHNAQRERAFTVSYIRPNQVLLASMAAIRRDVDNSKPWLEALPTFPARRVDGMLVDGAYLYLDCELDRVVDGFGENSLIVGRVVAAHVHMDALRSIERDDNSLVYEFPLLAYLNPGRFASVERTHAFPYPVQFET